MDAEPLVRVVRGNPTPEELAAAVGVLLARLRTHDAAATVTVSEWVRHARPGRHDATGLPTRPGAGAWRASALPR